MIHRRSILSGSNRRAGRLGRRGFASFAFLAGLAFCLDGFPLRSADAKDPSRLDYATFRIIAERNIFNARRSGRSSDRNREARRATRVDAFGLVGTMSSEKGRIAFFDGTSSDFRKALRPGATIAGYTVAEINLDAVKLDADGKTIELRVGAQMRREEDKEWQVTTTRESFAQNSSPTNSGAGDSPSGAPANGGGEVSDVLKRLMQKREQEMNR